MKKDTDSDISKEKHVPFDTGTVQIQNQSSRLWRGTTLSMSNIAWTYIYIIQKLA